MIITSGLRANKLHWTGGTWKPVCRLYVGSFLLICIISLHLYIYVCVGIPSSSSLIGLLYTNMYTGIPVYKLINSYLIILMHIACVHAQSLNPQFTHKIQLFYLQYFILCKTIAEVTPVKYLLSWKHHLYIHHPRNTFFWVANKIPIWRELVFIIITHNNENHHNKKNTSDIGVLLLKIGKKKPNHPSH